MLVTPAIYQTPVPGTTYAELFACLSHIILIRTYFADNPITGPMYFIDEETEV